MELSGLMILLRKLKENIISNNEKGYRSGENVYAAMGRTTSGRYLIVFFIYKTDKHVLILSARDMTKSERRLYEKT